MCIKIPNNLKLVVFDIDDTIHHSKLKQMPRHIVDILQCLHEKNVVLAIASLNEHAPYILNGYNISYLFDFVEYRLNINECFTDEEIVEYYSLRKINMFERLANRMDIAFENMLFFDDSVVNILDARRLKIKSICVNAKKLVTWQNIRDGLALFDKRKRRFSHDSLCCL